jgi:hypothetical protein
MGHFNQWQGMESLEMSLTRYIKEQVKVIFKTMSITPLPFVQGAEGFAESDFQYRYDL